MAISHTAPGYQEDYAVTKAKREDRKRRRAQDLVTRGEQLDHHQFFNLDNATTTTQGAYPSHLITTTPPPQRTITEYYNFLSRRFRKDREAHYREIFLSLQDHLGAVAAGTDVEYQEQLTDFDESRDRELVDQYLHEEYLISRANKVSQADLDRLDAEQRRVQAQVRDKLVKWIERQIKRLGDSRDVSSINNETASVLLAGFGNLDIPPLTGVDTLFAKSLRTGSSNDNPPGSSESDNYNNDDNEDTDDDDDENTLSKSSSSSLPASSKDIMAPYKDESLREVFEVTPPEPTTVVIKQEEEEPTPVVPPQPRRRGRPASAANIAKRALEKLNQQSSGVNSTTTNTNTNTTTAMPRTAAIRRSTRGNPNTSDPHAATFHNLESIKAMRKKARMGGGGSFNYSTNLTPTAAAAAAVSTIYASSSSLFPTIQDLNSGAEGAGNNYNNYYNIDTAMTPGNNNNNNNNLDINQLSGDDLRYVLSDMDITPYSTGGGGIGGGGGGVTSDNNGSISGIGGGSNDRIGGRYSRDQDRGNNSGSNAGGGPSSGFGNNYGAGKGKSMAKLNSLRTEEIASDLLLLKRS